MNAALDKSLETNRQGEWHYSICFLWGERNLGRGKYVGTIKVKKKNVLYPALVFIAVTDRQRGSEDLSRLRCAAW